MIRSHAAQKWLCKLRYQHKNILRDVFVDEHEWSYVIEDYKKNFKKMEELKLNIIEFEEDGTMKLKACLSDCEVSGNN